jgi:hypothetical protein
MKKVKKLTGRIIRARRKSRSNPGVAKAGGLQSQRAGGAAIANLLQAPGNDGSGTLRLSRRVETDGLK